MKRWLKTFLILIAIFLLPTLWLLLSHIRAKSALEKYKAQLRAAGEKLTVDELLPPRVPLEKNGAKLYLQAYPYVHFEGLIYSNPPPAMQMVAPGKAMVGWQQPCIVSQAPVMTNSWNELDQLLKNCGTGLELLRQAAERPKLDFGLDYHLESLGTHLPKMKSAALLLSAATIYDLNRGQTSSAVTNLDTLVTLVNKWNDERTVISQLVRIAMAAIASAAQWEVLQSTNLTDPQLAMLQHDWELMEFVQPMEHTLEMGRAREILDIQDLRTSNSPSTVVDNFDVVLSSAGSSGTSSYSLKNFGLAVKRKTSDILWRTSWSYHDELRFLQDEQIIIETVRQVETNGFFKDALAEEDRKSTSLGYIADSTNWLRMSLKDELLAWYGASPDFDAKAVESTMRIEATRRIVITAIALKRYQLRHGTWPADLKTLVPDFLSEVPRDPVDGLPLRYHTNADGTFTLYSIGSDNTDNGGDPSPSGSSLYWQKGHDWVWPQPATPEEIQQYYTKLQQPTSVYK